MNLPARILTIAGSDSSGGAGIQADLKTIQALAGYCMSALTAITAQNTLGVFGAHAIPAAMVAQQLEAVLDDPGVDAIKTGMLLNSRIIDAIAEVLDERGAGIPLVLDPVMVATSGARLIDEEAQESIITGLLARSALITPNLPEAEALTGLRITDQQSLEAAGHIIHDLGGNAVLIKGGHREGDEVIDYPFDGACLDRIPRPTIQTAAWPRHRLHPRLRHRHPPRTGPRTEGRHRKRQALPERRPPTRLARPRQRDRTVESRLDGRRPRREISLPTRLNSRSGRLATPDKD